MAAYLCGSRTALVSTSESDVRAFLMWCVKTNNFHPSRPLARTWSCTCADTEVPSVRASGEPQGHCCIKRCLKASPQDLRSIGLEPRPTPPWSGHWRLAPGLEESLASRCTGNLSAEPRRDGLNATVPFDPLSSQTTGLPMSRHGECSQRVQCRTISSLKKANTQDMSAPTTGAAELRTLIHVRTGLQIR